MKAIRWNDKKLEILDQTLLPNEKISMIAHTYQEVAEAIINMKVRGAPAIGVSAAYGMVLAAQAFQGQDRERFISNLEGARRELAATRPTAVNLFWALDRMKEIWTDNPESSVDELIVLLEREARNIDYDDLERNKRLGNHGCELVPQDAVILTHCNAGALATSGYGTALGVIRSAQEKGRNIHVYADETRPLLQGSRLTVWELMEDGIPVTLITDNMAAYLMQQKKIDMVIVGADRIASNGDVANKIGTYGVAVLANYHGIPFYVAAPISTIDMTIESGNDIPIEERNQDEVRRVGGILVAPKDAAVYNPAFDVTPAKLISAIITEEGIIRPPYRNSLGLLFPDKVN